jgi:ABC-2 type transport system ATP-binding protein
MNTTLRTIGRPDELRDQLFAKTLTVQLVDPLAEPKRVFGAQQAVESWAQDGPATYVLSVSDIKVAAPETVRARVAEGADVLSVSQSQHSLEDVYLELLEPSKEDDRK